MTDYRTWVEDKAAELGADGCTGVSGMYVWCCKEHDVHRRLRTRRDGSYISDKESDDQFRSCIQRESRLGWWNPIAWIRWLGLTWFVERRPDPVVRKAPSLKESPAAARARIIAEVEADRR